MTSDGDLHRASEPAGIDPRRFRTLRESSGFVGCDDCEGGFGCFPIDVDMLVRYVESLLNVCNEGHACIDAPKLNH